MMGTIQSVSSFFLTLQKEQKNLSLLQKVVKFQNLMNPVLLKKENLKLYVKLDGLKSTQL